MVASADCRSELVLISNYIWRACKTGSSKQQKLLGTSNRVTQLTRKIQGLRAEVAKQNPTGETAFIARLMLCAQQQGAFLTG